MNKLLAFILVAAVLITLGVNGCHTGSGHEHPTEHPSKDKKKTEHPKSDHPKSEHPTEQPKSD